MACVGMLIDLPIAEEPAVVEELLKPHLEFASSLQADQSKSTRRRQQITESFLVEVWLFVFVLCLSYDDIDLSISIRSRWICF